MVTPLAPLRMAPMTQDPGAWQRAMAARGRRRRSSYQMTPEEEESNLAWLGRGAMSGLATFAHTFGKPGAAVRGTLSGLTGGPWGGGALNLIPFSNTLGITDPNEWVWSRDMMRRAGLVGPRDTWGNFAAGLTGDVLLDPLAWMTGGASAATKAGQVLHKAGLSHFLPDVLAKTAPAGAKALGPRAGGMTTTLGQFLKNLPEEVGTAAPQAIERARLAMKLSKSQMAGLQTEPLRGLARIAPPFARGGALVGQNVPGALPLAQGLDVLGRGLRYSAPIRALSAGFSKPLMGQMSAAGQQAAARASRLKEFRLGAAREAIAGDITELHNLGLLREDMQGIADARTMRQYLEGTASLPENMQSAQPILDRMKSTVKTYLVREQAEGMPTEALSDVVDYFTRQPFRFQQEMGAGGGARSLWGGHKFQRGRAEYFKGLTLGSESVNRMSIDPALSGTAFKGRPSMILTPQVRKAIEEKFAGGLKGQGAKARAAVRRQFPQRTSAGVDVDAAVAHLRANYADDIEGWTTLQIQQLAKHLSELDPQHGASGIPLFAHNPVVDILARIEHGEHAIASAQAARRLMAENARYVSEAGAGDVPLERALAMANLTGENAPSLMVKSLPSRIVDKFKPGVTAADDSVLKNVYVPQEIAADLGRLNKTFTAPDWAQGMVSAFDNFTNFFRAHVTTYFPAFINRNLISGQINNAIGGAYGPAAGGMLRALRDTHKLLSGEGVISGVLDIPYIRAQGITDPVLATRKIAELAFAHKLGGKMQTEFAQHLGGTAQASLGDITGQLPGLHPFSVRETMGKLGPGVRPSARWNPLAVRGVGGTRESQFFLSQWGEDANYWVESMNRIAPFVAYLRKGWDPATAANRVKLMQVDYMAAAGGDQMMRRLMPFWAFVKGQSQFVAREVLEKPGGALAQTIHAEARGHQQLPPFSPEYVQTSAAIPGEHLPESVFGKAPQDSSRVITALGLMHEDPLQFMGTDPRHPIRSLWKGPLHEAAGRLNPLLQAPLEALTGRSLWQAGPRGGRPLSTMDPALGRLLSNLTGAEEPPKLGALETLGRLGASRWISTAKGLTDERKTVPLRLLNALTGMRVTDVTPAARESQMREQIQALQQEMGGRVFEVVNIPKEDLARMTPEERKKAENLKLLWKVLGERAKRRAATATQ